MEFKDNSLIIKSSDMNLEVDATPNAEFFTGYNVSEDLIRFESKVDFEIELVMTPGDASTFYNSKDMNRTYVDNYVRVAKLKLGDKLDFKPICGHFTEDMDLFRTRFEDEFMANVNEKIIDVYYESLIQARHSVYQKEYDVE